MDIRTFYCVGCKETYEAEWTEEEALKEYSELFPNMAEQRSGPLCDDCFEACMEFNEPAKERYKKNS